MTNSSYSELQDMVKSGYPAIALDAMSTSILTELYGHSLAISDTDLLVSVSKKLACSILALKMYCFKGMSKTSAKRWERYFSL